MESDSDEYVSVSEEWSEEKLRQERIPLQQERLMWQMMREEEEERRREEIKTGEERIEVKRE